MSKLVLTHGQVHSLAVISAEYIARRFADTPNGRLRVYPVPRGGVPAALALKSASKMRVTLVDSPHDAHLIFDDIIDSGSTRQRYLDAHPRAVFSALVDKIDNQAFAGQWVVFPWEKDEVNSVEDNIRRLLQYVGEDANREGLLETPARVAKAWGHWCSGYTKDAGEILKVFEDGAEGVNQMVTVKDIPIYSHCEHHLAPIFGTATISYIPRGKIVGLSKLSRLADMFARRLQVQERMTHQIAQALHDHLDPIGVGVVIKARHMCMESRGICQQGHYTVTTSLRGAMMDDSRARAEFLQIANG